MERHCVPNTRIGSSGEEGVGKMESRSVKVITLGPECAGKTCLLLKATNKDFLCPADYKCTVGVDFKVKTFRIDGIDVKMSIWDTAGQERFQQINRMYYRDVQATLFIFDLTSHSSFESIDFYWDDFHQFSETAQKTYRVLIGNKTDLAANREVSREEAERWAGKWGVEYVETSAMTGEGVEGLFEKVAREAPKHKVNHSSDRSLLSRSRELKKKPRKWC